MQKQAMEFVRFRDLDEKKLKVDFQVHTVQTDGQATIAAILQEAQKKSLSAIAFTEHVRRETDWFDDFAGEVKTVARDYSDITVYVGCETKALDQQGTLDVTQRILDACEIVLGVVHRFPDGAGGYLDFESLDPMALAEMECDLALGMLKYAPIDVLGHPGGMYQRRYGAYPLHLFRRMVEASLERDVAIEINSSYLVDIDAFLDLCNEINPRVSIGSDVHKLEEIGLCHKTLMERGIGQLKRS